MSGNVNLTQELHDLQERKSTLQQAVRIAASLDKLNRSLKAVILMGKPTSSISEKSLAYLDEMDEKTRNLSSTKLKEILERLESAVKKKLSLILKIAAKEDQDAEASTDEEVDKYTHDEIDSILKEYLKSAQTALALKIMLRARGETTKPTKLSLPAADIKKKLSEVDAREKKCRVKVKKEMTGLIHDTDNMLERDNLPQNLREMIKATRDSLELNLRHIASGGNIDDMPVSIENVEMGGEREDVIEIQPVITKRKKKADGDTRNRQTSRRAGFFYILWRWLTTPPSVGWQDIEEEANKKIRKRTNNTIK